LDFWLVPIFFDTQIKFCEVALKAQFMLKGKAQAD